MYLSGQLDREWESLRLAFDLAGVEAVQGSSLWGEARLTAIAQHLNLDCTGNRFDLISRLYALFDPESPIMPPTGKTISSSARTTDRDIELEKEDVTVSNNANTVIKFRHPHRELLYAVSKQATLAEAKDYFKNTVLANGMWSNSFHLVCNIDGEDTVVMDDAAWQLVPALAHVKQLRSGELVGAYADPYKTVQIFVKLLGEAVLAFAGNNTPD